MNQTAYTGTNNLIKKVPYMGGICKFWFIPKEEVESIPPIDPLNQYLSADITLKTDKVWRGPVPVPDNELGIVETQENGKGGPFIKIKLSGNHPGDIPQSRVNYDNMMYGQYVIVAKMRSGGHFLVIGNTEKGADFDHEYDSGSGHGKAANNKIAFTHEQIYRALVVPTFNGTASGYVFPEGGGGGGADVDLNDTEIIYITNESSKSISWTTTRANRFGNFPVVEVWLYDADRGTEYLAAVQPYIDAPPPAFTLMSFEFGGNVSGFIVLK